MELYELLSQQESDWLDFKRQWYDDTADMILDILCLANSDANSDRYLVIGYDEKENIFGDISINRKNRDDFYNILATANFNRIPNIHLKTIIAERHEIDIIIIEKTNHRPYFLLEDKPKPKKVHKEENSKKSKKEKIVRAGVIYTRNGSSNTPINESASENQIADMWRDRFGLTLSSKERLSVYVKDHNNWKYVCNPNDDNANIWHYEPFPEFTIEYNSPENMRDYSNPPEYANDSFAHSIGNSYQTKIKYKYHTTILDADDLFLCDKHHFAILYPHSDWLYYNPKNLTDIHIFHDISQVSDRGKTVMEIDSKGHGRGEHNKVDFYYNINGSFEYYIQRILNNGKYSNNRIYNIYIDYVYTDISTYEGNENENIVCPGRIYLIEQDEDIATRLRAEFTTLQHNRKKVLSNRSKTKFVKS